MRKFLKCFSEGWRRNMNLSLDAEQPEVISRMSGRYTSLIIAVLLIISALLAFIRIDNAYLWEDEAQVAIAARNLVDTGHLTGWDGRNLYGFRNGMLLDENLRPINSPLDIVLTAASFKLFGISTWSARFPFVLCGMLTLFVFWKLVGYIFSEQKEAAIYAFALFALSTSFLLEIRTCRYYAAITFAAVLLLYAYYRCLKSRSAIYYALLLLAAVIFFYSQYFIAVCFFATLLIMHVLFYRRDFAGSYPFVAVAATGFALLTVPYALYSHIWLCYRNYHPDMKPVAPHLS